MSERLPSGMLVSALLRRVNDAGGIGVMLARGDAQGGGILIIALESGQNPRALERGVGPDGAVRLIMWTPQDVDGHTAMTDYWRRRRRNDPDLWVIELDSPFAERFAAETILTD